MRGVPGKHFLATPSEEVVCSLGERRLRAGNRRIRRWGLEDKRDGAERAKNGDMYVYAINTCLK